MSLCLRKRRVRNSFRARIAKPLLLVVALLALSWILIHEFSPSRQVLKAQEQLISSVEARDWDSVSRKLADDYSDKWSHTPQSLIEGLQTAASAFTTLLIEKEVSLDKIDSRSAKLSARIKINGNGPFSGEVIRHVNGLSEPFYFEWRREGWQPWNWKLVSASQTELESQFP